MDGWPLLVTGWALLAVAVIAFRGWLGCRRHASMEGVVDQSSDRNEQTTSDTLQETVIRLSEYRREIEAHMQSRIAELDGLIRDADAEIIRLKHLLAEQQSSAAPLTPRQVERAWELHELGLSAEEISRCIGCPAKRVHHLLDEWQVEPQRRAA